MKPALILDADQRSALAVTRSLGRQGIPVYTAEESSGSLAGCSRYSLRDFTYPSPRLHPEQFVATLAQLVEEQHIDVLLPMTELTTALSLGHQAAFPDTAIPFPNIETVDTLVNKCSLMRMAEALDIPVPRTWYADSPDTLPCRLEELPYPLVIKPGKSWLLQDGEWQRAAVRFAASPAEARTILDTDPVFLAHPFMLQECVDGHGEGIFALYDNGTPVVFFAHRRVREKPPSGGVSVLSESVAVDPVLESHARLLLGKAGWHGIAMVEFKVANDGTPYLMEINTRFWGSLQLAIDAGIDFPYLLYLLACGERPEPVGNYKTGIRLRWLLGDLDSLYLTLRDRHTSTGIKLQALLQFLTPSPFRTRHEVDRWSDLGPARHEARQYIADLLR